MLCACALTIFGLDEGKTAVASPEMGRNRRNARFFGFHMVTLKVVFSVLVYFKELKLRFLV